MGCSYSCSNGYYITSCNVFGDPSCNICYPGSYCDGLYSYACPAGTFSSGYGWADCVDASVGYYVPSSGYSYQIECNPGTYQSNYGQSSCINCVPGYYQPYYAGSTCYGADGGYYVGAYGQSYETECSSGKYSTGYASSCTDCSAGTYNPSAGMSYCTNVPGGYYLASTGQTSYSAYCTAGTYSPAGSTSCTDCSPGSYSSSNAASSCTLCAQNTYSASYAATSCTNCPNQYYSLSGYSTCYPAPTSAPSSQPSRQPTGRPSRQPSSKPSQQPTAQPSSRPTRQPSEQPSVQPTCQPSSRPSKQPTDQPTAQPSRQPTVRPSSQPTEQPSVQPTQQPSEQPSSQPTDQPSSQPSVQPTERPTGQPSSQPSEQPSSRPSMQPSSQPSSQPSEQPTTWPTSQPSNQPTNQPSEQPSSQPSSDPSSQPSAQPSTQPTDQPSEQPSSQPTDQPSSQPTEQPSMWPSAQPSAQPSEQPSMRPSAQPSAQPSEQPTARPTTQPTEQPSMLPTGLPTAQPSLQPTVQPSSQPSTQPSLQPTSQPSMQPSEQPTMQPSIQPTVQPSSQPTAQPSLQPTEQPSSKPTGQPSSQPSGQPSMQPSSQPSIQPSSQPSSQPSTQPSRQPTGQPSIQPTVQPSSQPTAQPSLQPTEQPSSKPSGQPTEQPTGQPSHQPTCQPSMQPSIQPTEQPTDQPTCRPSTQPSLQPSGKPSTQPTAYPSSQPTDQPSSIPTTQPSRQPTMQPSSVPSSQPTFRPSTSYPTSSFLPTISTPPTAFTASVKASPAPTSFPKAKMVPNIVSLRIVPSSSSLTVYVNMSSPVAAPEADYAGMLYCAAFTYGTSPTSIVSVLGAGSSTAFASVKGGKSTVVQINKLYALTEYSVYCYLETSLGLGSSISQVQSTRTDASTSCCKTFTFTSAPVNVYGDSSKYTSAGASVSQFAFTFELSSPPSDTLVVVPTLSSSSTASVSSSSLSSPFTHRVAPLASEGSTGTAAASSASVSFTPSTFTFLNTSYPLTGQFILTAANVSSDLITSIKLSASGVGSGEFSDLTQSATVLSSTSPMPAPKLKSSIFSDNGNYVVVLFDTNTNLGGLSDGLWSCSDVFNFTSASSAACVWMNSTAVKATLDLSSSDLPTVGSNITLYGGKLAAACLSGTNCTAYGLNVEGVVSISEPFNPTVPVTILSTASKIGPCANLVLDASPSYGDGGRGWSKITWSVVTVSGGGTSASTLSGFLNKVTTVAKAITVPKAWLTHTTYFITLKLTNFLGQYESTTATVTVSSDRSLPFVQINGASSQTIKANQALEVMALASPSSCTPSSEIVTLQYSWSISLSNSSSSVLPISSESLYPKAFKLSSYTLTAGNTYVVKVSVISNSTTTGAVSSAATSSVTVYVVHGSVVDIISGFSVRSLPIDKRLVLSAINSYDEDTDSASTSLSFSWSCALASGLLYGQDCGVFSSVNTTDSVLIIPANTLSSGVTYAFTNVASSSDGRSSFSTSVVDAISAASASVMVTYSGGDTKFNVDSPLMLTGAIKAASAMTSTWTVFYAGYVVTVPALTALSVNFTTDEVVYSIRYPVAFGPNAFTSGCTYTLRLSASPVSRGLAETGYGEITLVANAVPYAGSVKSDPTTGTGLHTTFTIYASGWVDDASDYPLQYAFYYQQDPTYQPLSVFNYSQTTYVSAQLPTGLFSNDYALSVLVRVADIYFAVGKASSSVVVGVNEAFQPTQYLQLSLAKALAAGNSDSTNQLVNGASSMMNLVNCTSSPNCTQLNRANCATVPNTCGSCLTGFSGIVGPANKKCFNSSLSVGQIGSKCATDNDCLYGYCYESYCASPEKTCPTQISGLDCSGHGTCKFTDTTGVEVESCSILNVYCTVSCACNSGYGGSDCSLNSTMLAEYDDVRGRMCAALLQLSEMQDKSTKLLNTLVTSLLTVYSPTEVSSTSSTDSCTAVLAVISSLAKDGYLQGAEASTVAFIASTMSSFVGACKLSGCNSSVITDSVAGLAAGVLQTMVSGQTPVDLVSDNIRMQVRKDLLTSMKGASLVPPATAAESAYGAIQPSIGLGADGLSSCASYSKGYSELSVMQWGKNPYANSTSLKSSLIQLDSSVGYKSPKHRRTLMESTTTGASQQPTYFVTLQFSQPAKFNLSEPVSSVAPIGSNLTLPKCQFRDGSQFTDCHGCNISSYTDYNVTYGCYDDQKLCPTPHRRLSSIEEPFVKLSSSPSSSSFRRLDASSAGNDDTLIVSDDDGGTNENTGVSVYGTLIEALFGELASVLSGNPFAFDPSKAKAVLAFTSALVFLLVFGVFYFSKWDKDDRIELVYSKKGKLEKSRKQFKRRLSEVGNAKEYMKSTTAATNELSVFKRLEEIMFPRKYSISLELLSALKAAERTEISNQPQRIIFEEEDSNSGSSSYEGFSSASSSSGDDYDQDRDDDDQDQVGSYHQKKRRGSSSSGFNNVGEDVAAVGPLSFADDDKEREQSHFDLMTYTLQFMQEVVPKDMFFSGRGSTFRTLSAILSRHDFTMVLGRPSLRNTHTARWLTLCRGVLIGLFTDTLFFGICFPSDSTCEIYLTQAECISIPSKVEAGRSLCLWTKDASPPCGLRPPPGSITFYLMAALMILIISIPIARMIGFVQEQFGGKRPRLEQIGLTTDHWLGPSSGHKATEEVIKRQMKDYEDDEEEGEGEDGENGDDGQVVRTSDMSTLGYLMKLAGKEGRRTSIANSRVKKVAVAQRRRKITTDYMRDVIYIPKMLLHDYQSAEEEAEYIMESVRDFFHKRDEEESAGEGGLPYKSSVDVLLTGTSSGQRDAQIRAIVRYLGVYRDGEPAPLPLLQQLRYGTAQNRLACKLEEVHDQTKEVLGHLKDCEDEPSIKDVVLIQSFILEQFTVFKRLVLEELFVDTHEYLPPEEIDAIPWLLAWIFIDGCLFFFIFWIFRWGVYNGGDTLSAWGICFGIGLVQDVFLIQGCRISIKIFFTTESMQQQLKAIYLALSNAILDIVQEGESDYSQCDLRLVQHMSASCRASRMTGVKDLPAAAVLRSLDDIYMEKCREDRSSYRSMVAKILVILTVSVLVFLGDVGNDVVQVIVASFWTAYMLIAQLIYTASPTALIIVQAVCGFLVVYFMSSMHKQVARTVNTRVLGNQRRVVIKSLQNRLMMTFSPNTLMRMRDNQITKEWLLLNSVQPDVPLINSLLSSETATTDCASTNSSQRERERASRFRLPVLAADANKLPYEITGMRRLSSVVVNDDAKKKLLAAIEKEELLKCPQYQAGRRPVQGVVQAGRRPVQGVVSDSGDSSSSSDRAAFLIASSEERPHADGVPRVSAFPIVRKNVTGITSYAVHTGVFLESTSDFDNAMARLYKFLITGWQSRQEVLLADLAINSDDDYDDHIGTDIDTETAQQRRNSRKEEEERRYDKSTLYPVSAADADAFEFQSSEFHVALDWLHRRFHMNNRPFSAEEYVALSSALEWLIYDPTAAIKEHRASMHGKSFQQLLQKQEESKSKLMQFSVFKTWFRVACEVIEVGRARADQADKRFYSVNSSPHDHVGSSSETLLDDILSAMRKNTYLMESTGGLGLGGGVLPAASQATEEPVDEDRKIGGHRRSFHGLFRRSFVDRDSNSYSRYSFSYNIVNNNANALQQYHPHQPQLKEEGGEDEGEAGEVESVAASSLVDCESLVSTSSDFFVSDSTTSPANISKQQQRRHSHSHSHFTILGGGSSSYESSFKLDGSSPSESADDQSEVPETVDTNDIVCRVFGCI